MPWKSTVRPCCEVDDSDGIFISLIEKAMRTSDGKVADLFHPTSPKRNLIWPFSPGSSNDRAPRHIWQGCRVEDGFWHGMSVSIWSKHRWLMLMTVDSPQLIRVAGSSKSNGGRWTIWLFMRTHHENTSNPEVPRWKRRFGDLGEVVSIGIHRDKVSQSWEVFTRTCWRGRSYWLIWLALSCFVMLCWDLYFCLDIVSTSMISIIRPVAANVPHWVTSKHSSDFGFQSQTNPMQASYFPRLFCNRKKTRAESLRYLLA